MGNPYKVEPEFKTSASKVTLFHGVMGSGKTAGLINLVEMCENEGFKYLIIKPELDTRSEGIKSRDGRTRPCEVISDTHQLIELLTTHSDIDYLFIDEAQFFNPDFIHLICICADYHEIANVLFFSLKTDFMDNTFPAWTEITRFAERWSEFSRLCEVCGQQRATHNMRVSGGEELFVVGTDNYKSVCDKCFNEKKGK